MTLHPVDYSFDFFDVFFGSVQPSEVFKADKTKAAPNSARREK
jgi:hypothetical protein